jgi:hypothetical protein
MKILIACEESQAVCKAFRAKGHEAYSCDTLPCSGGHPEWHIQDDVLKHLDEGWDMMIAHPPCTFLTVTGNRWFKDEYKDRFPTRQQDRRDAIRFFMALVDAPIGKICIENPVGIMSREYRKPDQYIHPYHFGDPHSKRTGLWLQGLPKLKHTNVVEPLMYTYKDGRKDPIWHMESINLPPDERQKVRSKTFQGIADAMADQWGNIKL